MDKLQPYVALVAAVLRDLLGQLAPQSTAAISTISDVVLVALAVVALLLALIVISMIFNAIGSLFRPRRRAAKTNAAAPTAGSRRSAASGKADPVEKMRQEASAKAAQAKEDAVQLAVALTSERDRVSEKLQFAQVLPTTALSQLADTLVVADEPALAAARRKVIANDFDGARTDLRRYAEGPGAANPAAWRNLGALECLHDLAAAIAAFEKSSKLDANQFVTLVALRRLYSGSGRLEEGRKAAAAAIAAAGSDREMAIGYDELGEAHLFLKDPEGARQAFAESLAIAQKLSDGAPLDVEFRRDVAVGHFKLAGLGGPDGRDHLSRSIAAFERIKASGKLAADDQAALKQLKNALAEMDRQT
jgi:tetratricopeptide (TPR) repeat protein